VAATVASIAAAWPRELTGLALVAVDETDSTQRLARTLLERHLSDDEALPPCCVLALAQTRGRGRRGRSWASGPGLGVWATVVGAVNPSLLGTLPLRSAAALAAALAGVVPSVRVKWPNDLVVEGRKLGGLLIEAVVREPERAWAMVGFGVNARHDEDALPTLQATSLRRLGVADRALRLESLAPMLAGAVWSELRVERDNWLDDYRARSAHRPGDRIECDLEGERVVGELVDFDIRGALRLRTADGERAVAAGDVYSW
jgi:BirA family transcriptional regulator, biotin operon repressor / biotin---[acetyl-CoA-carboxylase] ligase